MSKYSPSTILQIREKALTMTAQQLAFEFGVSKNAIIGLCRREEIPLTAFANRVHPQGVAAVRHRRKKALAKVVLPEPAVTMLPVPPTAPRLNCVLAAVVVRLRTLKTALPDSVVAP